MCFADGKLVAKNVISEDEQKGGSRMIRVVLADDEAMIRAGVSAILAADTGIEVVAEAEDGRAAVEQVRSTRPDVGVIMLTTFGEDAYIERALRPTNPHRPDRSPEPERVQTGRECRDFSAALGQLPSTTIAAVAAPDATRSGPRSRKSPNASPPRPPTPTRRAALNVTVRA